MPSATLPWTFWKPIGLFTRVTVTVLPASPVFFACFAIAVPASVSVRVAGGLLRRAAARELFSGVLAAQSHQLLRILHFLQRGERRPHHVVRVGRTERLGQHVG